MQFKLPSKRPTRTAVYNRLKGVDFSKDDLLIDTSRTPNGLNLIADKSGLPQKRLGFRILHSLSAPINGLFHGVVDGISVNICHAGTTLYKFTDLSLTRLATGLSNTPSCGFFMEHDSISKLFLLTGNDYISYDGVSVSPVCNNTYTPTILVGKSPLGGGKELESVNLLSAKRIECFKGNGSDKVYQLSANSLDSAAVTVTVSTLTSETMMAEGSGFSVNRATGQVTFTTAPPAPAVSPIPNETAKDNVKITYSKTILGNADKIKRCNLFAYYGLWESNHIFVTGNPDYKSADFWCGANDPTYFPEKNTAKIGNDNTRIMGYAKLSEYLVIIKEDNELDTTIFLRNAVMRGDKATFLVKQGVTGTGAISPYSFASLVDEPLFLSKTGVYAVVSNNITAQSSLQNRSYFVDGRLTKEKNLENAVAVQWNGYYILAVNGNAYLLDSRQRTQTPRGNVYECYFWDNIPATRFLACNDTLYYGTADGKVVRMNNDIQTINRYSDNGRAIRCIWDTKADNDGLSAYFKTMLKKGGTLTIQPSIRTGARLWVSVDGEPFELVRSKTFSLLDWENLSFGAFTFLVSETPKRIYLNYRVKGYTTLQFRIENDAINQSFGIYELTKDFTVDNAG